tara:strand:+ start:315 stop:563 length:249 start_codon:yes stop_codon:yes gene_type:complete
MTDALGNTIILNSRYCYVYISDAYLIKHCKVIEILEDEGLVKVQNLHIDAVIKGELIQNYDDPKRVSRMTPFKLIPVTDEQW